MWKQFSQLQDSSLLCLKSSLPDLVLNSKAGNTILRYAYGWNRWKSWAKSKIAVVYLPAQPICVGLYLRHLLETARSVSPIDTAIYSIRWAHSLAGLSSPTDHPFVKATYDGCKRLLAKPRQPKEAVQPHMLERLTERHGHTGSSPGDLRLLFIVLVGYSGFLRISELLSMKTNHIQIMPEGMSVFLPTRKNDQFRAGYTIHIARTGKPTCPVVITERLLEALPGDRNDCLPVVRRLKRVRGLQTFHESRGISYNTAKDLLKRKLGVFFDDLRHLGMHSLRRGDFRPGMRELIGHRLADSWGMEMRGVKEQIYQTFS